MPKKVLATNCKVTNLPEGWSAKTNDTGTCIISVPDAMAGMFGGTIIGGSVSINGFTAESFDSADRVCLVGAPADFDEAGFHDM
ncbi:MAG: hypothetical protein Tsb006_3060 [Rickettsiaceae bacterium]